MDNCDQQSTMTSDDNIQQEELYKTREIDQLIINCVKTNNLRFLDMLLDEPESDLSCVYFGENMLMLAIRMRFEEMARFLIENGVDYNFEKKIFYTTVIDEDEILEYHCINCREMAYRHDMFDIVEVIDFLNKQHCRFYPPPKFQFRDRSEKPGMFHDVVSLNEEFFTNERRPSVINTMKPIVSNVCPVVIESRSSISDVTMRSKSANIERSNQNQQAKENKASFLRMRTSSAKSKNGRKCCNKS